MKCALLNLLSSAALFAQVPTVPTTTGSELLSILGALLLLGTIVSLYYQIMSHRRNLTEHEPKRRVLPDPMNVKEVKDHVTWEHFDRLDREFNERHEKLVEKMDRRLDQVFGAITKEAHRVDVRINDVLREVSKLGGAFDESRRKNKDG